MQGTTLNTTQAGTTSGQVTTDVPTVAASTSGQNTTVVTTQAATTSDQGTTNVTTQAASTSGQDTTNVTTQAGTTLGQVTTDATSYGKDLTIGQDTTVEVPSEIATSTQGTLIFPTINTTKLSGVNMTRYVTTKLLSLKIQSQFRSQQVEHK